MQDGLMLVEHLQIVEPRTTEELEYGKKAYLSPIHSFAGITGDMGVQVKGSHCHYRRWVLFLEIHAWNQSGMYDDDLTHTRDQANIQDYRARVEPPSLRIGQRPGQRTFQNLLF